jgi:hypothetical protein
MNTNRIQNLKSVKEVFDFLRKPNITQFEYQMAVVRGHSLLNQVSFVSYDRNRIVMFYKNKQIFNNDIEGQNLSRDLIADMGIKLWRSGASFEKSDANFFIIKCTELSSDRIIQQIKNNKDAIMKQFLAVRPKDQIVDRRIENPPSKESPLAEEKFTKSFRLFKSDMAAPDAISVHTKGSEIFVMGDDIQIDCLMGDRLKLVLKFCLGDDFEKYINPGSINDIGRGIVRPKANSFRFIKEQLEKNAPIITKLWKRLSAERENKLEINAQKMERVKSDNFVYQDFDFVGTSFDSSSNVVNSNFTPPKRTQRRTESYVSLGPKSNTSSFLSSISNSRSEKRTEVAKYSLAARRRQNFYTGGFRFNSSNQYISAYMPIGNTRAIPSNRHIGWGVFGGGKFSK